MARTELGSVGSFRFTLSQKWTTCFSSVSEPRRAMRIVKAECVTEYEIPSDIVRRCCGMPMRLESYFRLPEDVLLLPITEVILSRARPKGILGAVQNMR